MKIIDATEKHRNEVYALLCELEHGELNKARFEELFLQNVKNRDVFYLLAVEDGMVRGFASLHIQSLLHHVGAVGEIQEIVVTSEHRGRGIGKMLYDRLKQIAEDNQCVSFEVCCNQLRAGSHLFYLSQGMKNSHYKFTLPLMQSIS